jgi:hypothetical protein
MKISDEELGKVAYQKFQEVVGEDPARLPWDDLAPKSLVREKWIAIAKAVVDASAAKQP